MSKTIMITGSTDGIGKLAAIQLAKQSHHIILHGRDSKKLDRVQKEVESHSRHSGISSYCADLSEFSNVLNLSAQIKSEVDNLDILINNAGVFKSSAHKNSLGIDLRFAVNYFAPYILTKELIQLLNRTSDSRIINLSSAAQTPVQLEALKGSLHLNNQTAYAQSKLALTMWSFYLAQKTDLTVIAVNPGSLLNTNMVKEAYGHHWSEASKGANILSELSNSKFVTPHAAKYFDNDSGTYSKAHPDAYNQVKIDALIEVSESVLNS